MTNLPYSVRFEMGVPTADVGVPVTWKGVSMAAPVVVPLTPGAAFSAQGIGRFPLESRVSGTRGTLDLSFRTGATSTARTLLYLTDDLAATNYIMLGIDTSNRVLAKVTNSLGTVVADLTPIGNPIPASTNIRVRLTWDSTAVVFGSRRVYLSVDYGRISDAEWLTDPVASWVSFRPTYLVTGQGLGGAADFNGQILSVQVSDMVVFDAAEPLRDETFFSGATFPEMTATAVVTPQALAGAVTFDAMTATAVVTPA